MLRFVAKSLALLLLLMGCKAETPAQEPTPSELPQNERLIQTAQRYLNVRETDGFNRSPEIDRWNRFAGVPLGSPYCASFVSSVHKEAEIPAIVSAWSPDWGKTNLVKFADVVKGDVFGLYFPSKGRIAHVGFIEGKQGDLTITVEANTSPQANSTEAASREGDGVFRKFRPVKLMAQSRNRFSRWWN